MADLAQLLAAKPRPVAVVHEGETLNLTFNVNAITPEWQRFTDADDVAGRLGEGLAAAILEWDVTSDGAPWPPTAENVGSLPYPIQAALLRRILEAAIPSEAEGKASAAPTSTPSTDYTVPTATSPNGQAHSSSLVASAFPSQK